MVIRKSCYLVEVTVKSLSDNQVASLERSVQSVLSDIAFIIKSNFDIGKEKILIRIGHISCNDLPRVKTHKCIGEIILEEVKDDILSK